MYVSTHVCGVDKLRLILTECDDKCPSLVVWVRRRFVGFDRLILTEC